MGAGHRKASLPPPDDYRRQTSARKWSWGSEVPGSAGRPVKFPAAYGTSGGAGRWFPPRGPARGVPSDDWSESNGLVKGVLIATFAGSAVALAATAASADVACNCYVASAGM